MYELGDEATAKTEELYLVRHLAPIDFGDGFIRIVSEYIGARRGAAIVPHVRRRVP
jgi:hypothetical protein